MVDIEQQYHVLKTLTSIAQKTRSNSITHSGKLVLYTTLEISCYTIFLAFLVLVIFLPTNMGIPIEERNTIILSLQITSKEWQQAILLIKGFLLLMGMFPLAVGLLIRSSRKKSKTLHEVYRITDDALRLITIQH